MSISRRDLLKGAVVAGAAGGIRPGTDAVGGGLVGCETALWLAQKGRQVTIVEMLPELMTGGLSVPRMNRLMLLDLLAFNNVNVLTGACVREIAPDGVKVSGQGRDKMVKADTVVLAVGLQPDDTLSRKLRGRFARFYAIGDCREPRLIVDAIADGFRRARTI